VDIHFSAIITKNTILKYCFRVTWRFFFWLCRISGRGAALHLNAYRFRFLVSSFRLKYSLFLIGVDIQGLHSKLNLIAAPPWQDISGFPVLSLRISPVAVISTGLAGAEIILGQSRGIASPGCRAGEKYGNLSLGGERAMRSYNRWLFHEHFELVLTISELYKKLPTPEVLAVLNRQFIKPVPPAELSTSLNLAPWSKYDIDSLAEDFRLMFTRFPDDENRQEARGDRQEEKFSYFK
jgi:hypothetical protein